MCVKFEKVDEAIAYDKTLGENAGMTILGNIPETIELNYLTKVVNTNNYTINLKSTGLWTLQDQGGGTYITVELKEISFEYVSGGVTVTVYKEQNVPLKEVIANADAKRG